MLTLCSLWEALQGLAAHTCTHTLAGFVSVRRTPSHHCSVLILLLRYHIIIIMLCSLPLCNRYIVFTYKMDFSQLLPVQNTVKVQRAFMYITMLLKLVCPVLRTACASSVVCGRYEVQVTIFCGSTLQLNHSILLPRIQTFQWYSMLQEHVSCKNLSQFGKRLQNCLFTTATCVVCTAMHHYTGSTAQLINSLLSTCIWTSIAMHDCTKASNLSTAVDIARPA